VPGIDQEHFQTVLFEYFEHRHPVHAVDCIATLRTPFSTSHRAISSRSEVKHSKRRTGSGVAIRADRHPVLTAAHINACRVRMHDVQRFQIHFCRTGQLFFCLPASSYS
jgi:hypothetical protein